MTHPIFKSPPVQLLPPGRPMTRFEMVRRYGEAHVRKVEILSAITTRNEAPDAK